MTISNEQMEAALMAAKEIRKLAERTKGGAKVGVCGPAPGYSPASHIEGLRDRIKNVLEESGRPADVFLAYIVEYWK